MIELIIKNFLDEHLNVPSFFEHVADLPNRFVMVDRTGGNDQNGLKKAVVAFQSYAESLYEAANLNEHVKKVVVSMIALDNITKVKLNSDYNFTDTETKRYRYQAVFEFFYY
ncbi:hypothetical protein HO932_05310 [Streptococcus suis]|nr:hypothetical protein [Streptococcus suis]NQN95517.1 hypothetical protein [Streptococcus suis]NQO34594.1 hypothetical protein [Streptococcus suis]NQO44691.1 hypothetical protein [Streptococcus suis]NQO55349.1 hypothetical protein [Streptococcus suis]